MAKQTPDNFDDLLNIDDAELVPANAGPLDSVDARIKELEEAVSAPMPDFDADPEPDPEPAIDPDVAAELARKEARIKELEDQLARRNAVIIENSSPSYTPVPANGRSVLIHFETDGFIALGQTWYRGQELEVPIPSEAYERTKDRNGKSWLDMADNVQAQLSRWGQVYFAPGPFAGRPGERFNDDIATEDARRGRRAPVPRD